MRQGLPVQLIYGSILMIRTYNVMVMNTRELNMHYGNVERLLKL